ncbi:hypothetical protein F383_23454 [Gossypium arboreum]|uniref:Uncharacterized protein n=1 Tax=Gossypium arboreum TaxID=29729 RepID=A0A0B0NW63_GOSAR|nr:hypothetical protein F383_23454 [Gossypium arboreum]
MPVWQSDTSVSQAVWTFEIGSHGRVPAHVWPRVTL